MSKRMTWILGVAATIVAGLTVFTVRWGANFQLVHYAQSGETEERSFENEQRNVEQDRALAPILKIVEDLGNRAAADDAGLEQDKMRCLQCIIKDRDICGAAGVEVCDE